MEKRVGLSSRWFLGSVAALLVFGVGGQVFAQTDVTSSRISGTIYDEHGGVLPGVVVEARNQDTGLNLRALTDAKGSYRVLNLPTGSYTITATLAGFATAKHADVRLLLGSTPTVDFTMRLAAQAESITVTAAVPLVEVTNTSAATTLQTEQLQSLPISGRDFRSLVLLTPETRLDRERGGLSISGQRGINTNVTVDGVDYNNAFFGGTAGTAEGRAPITISQESIKEFSVITNGASVEFGRSGGGFVSVITKGGTNQFKGSAFYYEQPNSMVAKRVDGTSLDNQKRKQYGLSFGGPIIKDKLFFFTSYDEVKQTFNIGINSGVINPDFFAKWPVLTSDPQFVREKNGRAIFGRFDYQMTGSQRLSFRANYTDYDGTNDYYTNPNYSSTYNMLEAMLSRSYVGSYSGMLAENLLNDTNAQWYIEHTPRGDKNPTVADVRVGSYRYGGVYFAPVVSKAERKNIGDTVSYLYKDHVFKGGVEYNRTSISQTFKGDWRGDYDFASFADAIAGKWRKYTQFIGLNGLTADQAGTVSMSQKELALFVQDQWFIAPTLTASFGVRWEKLDNPNFPTLNPRDKNANGSYNLTSHIPDQNNQWSPRLGLTWSPGDAKTVVKFSAGRFWSRTPSILWAQLWSSNGTRGARYVVNCDPKTGKCDQTVMPGWGTTFTPVGIPPLDPTKIIGFNPTKLEVYTIDPNFKNPYTDRFTLGGEREIFKDTAIGLDVTYAKGYQLQRLTDLNLQYDIDAATGKPKISPVNGMPMYSKTRPNAYYGRVVTSVSDATADYRSVALTLHRRFTEQFFGFASVTWSQDKDSDSNERNYAGVQLEDVNNLDNNWGYSDRDQRWKFALNGVWNTPWWGISVSGLYRYTTGQPFTPLLNSDANGDGNSATDRPTINGQHLARNSYREPDFSTLDLRLQKAFNVGPGAIAVIVECFNCTNNANRYGPRTTWGTGQTPNADFGQTSPTNYTRTVQFALRYDF